MFWAGGGYCQRWWNVPYNKIIVSESSDSLTIILLYGSFSKIVIINIYSLIIVYMRLVMFIKRICYVMLVWPWPWSNCSTAILQLLGTALFLGQGYLRPPLDTPLFNEQHSERAYRRCRWTTLGDRWTHSAVTRSPVSAASLFFPRRCSPRVHSLRLLDSASDSSVLHPSPATDSWHARTQTTGDYVLRIKRFDNRSGPRPRADHNSVVAGHDGGDCAKNMICSSSASS